jgi:hypothetical protein
MIQIKKFDKWKKTWIAHGSPAENYYGASRIKDDKVESSICAACLKSKACSRLYISSRKDTIDCVYSGLPEICSKCENEKKCYPRSSCTYGLKPVVDLDDGINLCDIKTFDDFLVAAKIRKYTYNKVSLDLINGNAYTKARLPKKSGGFREISVPTEKLKLVQRLILENIFSKLPVHPMSHGGVKNKSVVTNAEEHSNFDKKALILDLKDFFPSITYKRINGILLKIGFNWDVVRKLTPLLTHKKVLPQGAPTSTWIANAVCHRMDTMFSRNTNLIYSRFVDDISITPAVNSYTHGKCMSIAVSIIENNGFEINKKKVRVGRSVCGVVIMDKRLTVNNSKFRKLRSKIHSASRDGFHSAAQHDGMTVEKFKQHVSGNLEFMTQVCGKSRKGLKRLKKKWESLL